MVYVNAAILWEIAINARLGGIEVKADLPRELEANRFLELPIHWRHARTAGALPLHHSDPFDRMLIAQARPKAFIW